MTKYLVGFLAGALFAAVPNVKASISTAVAIVSVTKTVMSAITFASAVTPLAAQTDARFICYKRDSSGWSVQGPVCPVLDPTIVSGFAEVPCSDISAPIATPSGAVLTDLKAKYKVLVETVPGACGAEACPSAD